MNELPGRKTRHQAEIDNRPKVLSERNHDCIPVMNHHDLSEPGCYQVPVPVPGTKAPFVLLAW